MYEKQFQGPRITDWLKYEDKQINRYSRANGYVPNGQGKLTTGTVMYRTAGYGASAAVPGGSEDVFNTGNGTVSAITAAQNAEPGEYTIEFTGAGATAAFNVIGPDGGNVGAGAVGTAYAAGGLGFTITDGSVHFAIGDSFTFGITENDGSFSVMADAGVADEIGILCEYVDASSADQKAAFIVRQAQVVPFGLVWPATGLTEANKLVVITKMASQGIIMVEGV